MQRQPVFVLLGLFVMPTVLCGVSCNKGLSKEEIRRLVRDEVQEQLRERKRRQAPQRKALKPSPLSDAMVAEPSDPKQRRVERLRRRIHTLETLLARFSKNPGMSKDRLEMLKKQLANMRGRLARAEGKPAAGPQTSTAPAASAKQSLKDWHDALAAGIRKLGPTRWEVDRRILKAVLAAPAQAQGDARILPAVVGGKPRGFKLAKVRPKGIFAVLGFKSGDVVEHINNKSLIKVSQALTLYMSLQKARLLTVQLRRAGKRIVHVYTIK